MERGMGKELATQNQIDISLCEAKRPRYRAIFHDAQEFAETIASGELLSDTQSPL